MTMGTIQPKSKTSTEREFKGTAPFKVDKMIYWTLKMIFQVVIFSLIYNLSIQTVHDKHGHEPFIEVLHVIIWIILSDTIAHVFALIIQVLFDRYKSYSRSRKNQKLTSKKVWEYIFYTLIRAIFYVLGMTQILSSLFQTHMTYLSTLVAWVIVGLISIALAKALSILLSIK